MMENRSCACVRDCRRQSHSEVPPPFRHRANGAVGALCNSPNCVLEGPDQARSGAGAGPDQSRSGAGAGPDQSRSGAGKVLVTGGAGYFGFRLGRTLAGQGATVLMLDLLKPPWDLPDGAVFQQVRGNWRHWVVEGLLGNRSRCSAQASGFSMRFHDSDVSEKPLGYGKSRESESETAMIMFQQVFFLQLMVYYGFSAGGSVLMGKAMINGTDNSIVIVRI